MSRRHRGHHGSEGGFTLLELLIAITLLGLLTTMAFSGLRLGARAWETAEEYDREIYLAQQLLRTRLSTAYAPSEFDLESQDGSEPAFEGGADYVRFLTPLPDLFGVGGLYRVTVEVAPAEVSAQLTLSWQLWRPDSEQALADDPEDDRSRVLLDGIEEAEFSFFGTDQEGRAPRWQETWQARTDLPALIRLRVEKPGSSWPPLVVAPQLGQMVHW